jgi:hypothetical protein
MTAGTVAPIAFVSYVHDDAEDGKLLKDFLDALAARLAGLAARKPHEALFVDRASLSLGDVWEPVLAEALRQAQVFVAMYSPRYFNKSEKKCYCGREFAAFRERSSGNNTTNILPVLWRVPPKKFSTFPPSAITDIQYALDSQYTSNIALKIYHCEGLEQVLIRKGRNAYQNILSDIANQILELAASAPEPLDGLPAFESIPCAFHDDQEEFASYPVAKPENLATQGGPRQIELIYASEDSASLAPELAEAGLSRLIFSRDAQAHILRWQVDDGLAQLIQTLTRATANAQIPIVVLPSDTEDRPGLREAAEQLVRTPNWSGALITLHTPTTITSTEAVRVATLTGDREQLRGALSSIIADIRRSMTLSAEIPNPVLGDGPDRMPRL